MSNQSGESVMAPITADDMARFHRNAPAALARRSGNFVGEQLGSAFELFVTGLVPIVGMLFYGWSSSQLLLLMLVGAWTGILLDIARLALCYSAVKQFGATHYDDWHVWTVAHALRKGHNEAMRSHLQARYQPGMGVLVDLLFGGVGTAAILAALAGESTSRLRELLSERTVLYGIAGIVAYQVVFAAWEIVRRISASSDAPMKVAVGMRGLGLFLLMFVVVMIRESAGENGALARGVMLFVNGAIVALAAFNAVGQIWVRRETEWLRAYLCDRGASDDGRHASHPKREGKKRQN